MPVSLMFWGHFNSLVGSLIRSLALALWVFYAPTAAAQTLPDVPGAEAAMAGDAKSQHRIGYYYHTGNYVAKDLDQALIWYKKAADQDLLKAQYAYGRLLAFEKEGPKDYSRALPWFIKAATPRDQSQGYGYDDSLKYAREALNWYCTVGAVEFPASHDYSRKAECLYARGKKLYAGSPKYKITRDLSAARIALTLAAEQGDNRANIILAKMNKFGHGLDRNEAEAKRLLRKAGQESFKPEDFIASDRLALAAQERNVQAHRKFAARYLKGTKYNYDPQRAMMHFFLAKRRRFLNGLHSDLIIPVFQNNGAALLARAHQDALDYAKDYNWPAKDIAQITKSYNRAVKKHRWLMARGGKMPSENEDTAFRFLLLFLSLYPL